jgi:hypothetical protein
VKPQGFRGSGDIAAMPFHRRPEKRTVEHRSGTIPGLVIGKSGQGMAAAKGRRHPERTLALSDSASAGSSASREAASESTISAAVSMAARFPVSAAAGFRHRSKRNGAAACSGTAASVRPETRRISGSATQGPHQAVSRTGATPCWRTCSRCRRTERSRRFFAMNGRRRIASRDLKRSDRRKVWVCLR